MYHYYNWMNKILYISGIRLMLDGYRCNKYNIVCNKCDRYSTLWRLSLQQ